eukprot:scaffold1451_cov267-Pinguiococcus_pyrenoidosus.AAC.5
MKGFGGIFESLRHPLLRPLQHLLILLGQWIDVLPQLLHAPAPRVHIQRVDAIQVRVRVRPTPKATPEQPSRGRSARLSSAQPPQAHSTAQDAQHTQAQPRAHSKLLASGAQARRSAQNSTPTIGASLSKELSVANVDGIRPFCPFLQHHPSTASVRTWAKLRPDV